MVVLDKKAHPKSEIRYFVNKTLVDYTSYPSQGLMKDPWCLYRTFVPVVLYDLKCYEVPELTLAWHKLSVHIHA